MGIEYVGLFVDDNGLAHTGLNGHRLDSLADVIPKVCALRPDVVILLMGGNGLPSQSPEQVGKLAELGARSFAECGASRVYVCTLTDVQGFSDRIAEYNQEIRRRVRLSNAVRLVEVGEVYGPAVPNNPFYADRAHPSATGAQALADLIGLQVFGIKPDGVRTLESSAHFGGVENDVFLQASNAISSAYPTMMRSVRQTAMAVGWLENGFGQSGKWVVEGVPSNNWGGITSGEPSKCATYIELDGGRFCRFTSLKEGSMAFYELWSKPEILAAAKRGDLWNVAQAMFEAGWYKDPQRSDYENISQYAYKLSEAAKTVCKALGEPSDTFYAPASPWLPRGANPVSGGNLLVLGLSATIFAATLMLSPKGAP